MIACHSCRDLDPVPLAVNPRPTTLPAGDLKFLFIGLAAKRTRSAATPRGGTESGHLCVRVKLAVTSLKGPLGAGTVHENAALPSGFPCRIMCVRFAGGSFARTRVIPTTRAPKFAA
jgi:hypothetical protein